MYPGPWAGTRCEAPPPTTERCCSHPGCHSDCGSYCGTATADCGNYCGCGGYGNCGNHCDTRCDPSC